MLNDVDKQLYFGVVRSGAGTAPNTSLIGSSESLRFLTGDTGTGTPANERMVIDSSGNVGIGCSPSVLLHLDSGATSEVRIDSSAHSLISLHSGSTQKGLVGWDNNNSKLKFVVGSGGLASSTSGLVIDTSGNATFAGNISIPATKKLYLDGGSNTYIYESAGDTIKFVAGMGGTALTLTTLQSTFSGSVQCGTNFMSSDGTSGANVVRSWEDPARDVHTVTIKDGLITSWVIA